MVRTVAAQTPIDVEFSPFYAMHRRSYTAYWDHVSAEDLTARAAELTAERERMRALEAATIAHADPGDREGEKKFNQQGVETSVIRTDGRAGRRAIQWFSYDLPLSGTGLSAEASAKAGRLRSSQLITATNAGRAALMCWSTAHASGPRRSRKAACRNFTRRNTRFPRRSSANRQTLTVRFEATNGLEVTPVFGVRLVRR